MAIRLRNMQAAAGAYQAMLKLEEYVENCGLEHSLLRLVQTRASQINGCAYCLDMHTKDARAEGETEQRLYVLPAWREAPFYSERERAALEWTEAVTLVAETHVPDEVYERVHARFSDEELANLTLAINAINSWNRINVEELANLTLAINAINSWNRINVAFRTPAGSYRPKTATAS